MSKISFTKAFPSFEAKEGSNLMQILLDNDHPVANTCGGEAVCGKCNIRVLSGSKHLTPMSPIEKEKLESMALPTDHRLSCQCKIQGDITIDTDYW